MATLKFVTVTIPAGQALSNVADCTGTDRVLRIITPQEWTAAPLTFQLSPDGVNFNDLYRTEPNSFDLFQLRIPDLEPGAEITLPADMGEAIAFARVRSGTPVTPIAQEEDSNFIFVLELPAAGVAGPAGPPGPVGPTGPAAPAIGVTDGSNAAAGMIGEQLSASAATGVAILTSTPSNIATLALPAGDWTLSGVVIFNAVAGSATPTSLSAAIGPTSQTLPTAAQVAGGAGNVTQLRASFASQNQTLQTGLVRVNLSAPATVYLLGQGVFASGTLTATGYISARRIR
jgi:hypothetical protein